MTRAKGDTYEEYRQKRSAISRRFRERHRKPRPTDLERFWSHVIRSGSLECWWWTGASANAGYGAFRIGGRTVKAHRWLWEQRHGSIPEGINILHHCDNTSCVNPNHLFSGTQADNVHDMMAKGRHVPPPNRWEHR